MVVIMADDETIVEDGMIPITCACGRIVIWRVDLGEDLPPCPACTNTDTDTDDAEA